MQAAIRVLNSFGASEKRGLGVRGFRGIGRLSALGFCQTLTFTTKASGESVATEVQWDCRRLRELLRDAEYDGSLSDIVRQVVATRTFLAEDANDHYFEVRLGHVVRVNGDALLDEYAVRRYLAQVAPVPLSPDFPFAEAIGAVLNPHVQGGHFEILVGDSPEPLVRPHRAHFQVTPTKRDTFVEWEEIELLDPDLPTPVAVGWIAHHNYLGGITAEPEISGIRARVGDIQVGGNELFAGIFPERRFNNWVVGEIHILDPRIAPNGRRDDFEHHPAVASLHNLLGPLGRKLAQKTRDSSKHRARIKAFDMAAATAEGILATLEEGLVRGRSTEGLLHEVRGSIQAMERALGSELFAPDDSAARMARLSTVVQRYEQVRSASPHPQHPLQHRPKAERDLYDRMVGIIFESIGDTAAARALLEQVAQRVALT